MTHATLTRREVMARSLAAGCAAAGTMLMPGLARSAAGLLLAPDASMASGPILFCTPGLLSRASTYWRSQATPGGREVYTAALAGFDATIAQLLEAHRKEKPPFSFTERSRMLDVTAIAGLATACGEKGDWQAKVIDVGLALADALRRAGRKDRDYHVGQGSNMLPLAMIYDWTYDRLTPEQRRELVQAMLNYSFIPTLDAMYVGGPKAGKTFWVSGYNNWTTICIGGALGLGLALRPADAPAAVTALAPDGSTVTRSFAEHWAEFLPIALRNLQRGFQPIRDNDGLQPEGTGYHHDTVLPLYGIVASVEAAYPDAAVRPDFVASFLKEAKDTAAVHINAGIHMAGPSGADWQYADGTWPLTSLPINLLIAHYAAEVSAPLASAAVWRAFQNISTTDRGLHLLYRPLIEPQPAFDPATIPTAHYFFSRLINDDKGDLAINEFVVTWRQNFTDPNACAVFFKGGDRRRDYHSHLDIGTFLYDALGVRWAIDIGRGEGYPYYFKDGVRDFKYVTTAQVYPKRAAGHNTLVLNPADNDYTRRLVPPPRDWWWQFNPDQCLFSGKVPPICPVEGLKTDPAKGLYRGSVNLYGAYQYHGVASKTDGAPDDPRRHFEFDLATGSLTIRDEIHFARTAGNDLHWFMHLDRRCTVTRMGDTRVLLSMPRSSDNQIVHCEVRLLQAEGGTSTGLLNGKGADFIPPAQPKDSVYFGYDNAKLHRESLQKLALNLTNAAQTAIVEVKLLPRPDLTGQDPQTVKL
jgi:hypothetical protein